MDLAIAWNLDCPYPYTPGIGAPFGVPHNHLYHHPHSFPMRAPRWAYNKRPCCEFCSALDHIPSLNQGLSELSIIMPDEVGDVLEAFDSIHHHYRWGFDRDGPDSYFLSREVEKLSRFLRRMYRFYPWVPQLGTLSEQLKYMGRDVQTGPRRLRYHTMPKHRYKPWQLLHGAF
ncbi:uncharacterized protein K460DRAFT_284583 [Cucurbitaria berberidis CBS 394.84]|uniref:Uncharacterized protein n=1 Tax=Cucurbitaria berberidis CBS 394.84 TaxID=1168544 RepID=A0A9P4GI94_9PLEO|nr:uncharacterized protein K460DRAFT_284583 [Cucurbitaria berberidis CBS 394.84]KAF1845620.1 hypothetical protein K460DRAFT_284583 [Cucurbitaria berberidis CBS 394.84]